MLVQSNTYTIHKQIRIKTSLFFHLHVLALLYKGTGDY